VSRITRRTIWRTFYACSPFRRLLPCHHRTRSPANDLKARPHRHHSLRLVRRLSTTRPISCTQPLTEAHPTEEGSADELGVASQTHSHDGDTDDDHKSDKALGLSAFLPVGTEVPSFFGLVQRAYVFAFPPASVEGETDSGFHDLSREQPYSATILIQDVDQVRVTASTLCVLLLTFNVQRSCDRMFACCESLLHALPGGTLHRSSLKTCTLPSSLWACV
jgi:hypothetical protein